MPVLRQSTAQTIRFGPCLDKTDGVTEETALTLAQADMRLSKDGGAFAQKSAAGNATHDSDGWYSTALSTTDTATVGELILNVHQPANMLPVWLRWIVMEEDIYDALYAVSAAGFDTNQRVDVGMWLGTAVTLGSGAPDVNIQSQDNIDFGATQKASINTEVDTALNTAIPGGPTADSINQRILAIDDLSQAAGAGDLAAILTDTNELQGDTHTAAEVWTSGTRSLTDKAGFSLAVGGVIDGALAAAELLNIADGCLDRRLDLGTDTGGDTTTSRTWRDALRILRNRADIVAGTLTVYEEDDTTAAFTAAISTAAGNPIAQVNPT